MTLILSDLSSTHTLTDQIVNRVQRLIDRRALRPGYRMPSIRRFAQDHGISSFTVIAAYDRLIALGYLTSSKGSGFYVAQRPGSSSIGEQVSRRDEALESLRFLNTIPGQKFAFAMPHLIATAAGKRSSVRTTANSISSTEIRSSWPNSRLEPKLVQLALRSVARDPARYLVNYGDPLGYDKLRALLVTRLAELGIDVPRNAILMTHGASHAFDLIGRYFVRPGDAVLVDDPGYLILFRHLELLGAKPVGIPRTPSGPDIGKLAMAIRKYKPRLFFINTLLQNPTGSSVTVSTAHQILRLAEQHQLTIVEDDAYGDLAGHQATRLATLDKLRHVIYVGSFSKTISSDVRVGYIACRGELAEELVDVKILTGLTTCETSERIVHQVLVSGHYRKHIERLHRFLEERRNHTIEELENCGLELFCIPEGGAFLWARLPYVADSAGIAQLAGENGIVLVPGHVFRPFQESSPWMRFNVFFCDDPNIFKVIRKIAKESSSDVVLRARRRGIAG